jgi:hypothetical protein
MKQFRNKRDIITKIDNYFDKILGNADLKPPDHPTITGLAVHLGFKSKSEFELYERKGIFKKYLEIARFKIMAYYESRLLLPSPAGAIFALKSMGWDDKRAGNEHIPTPTSIKIKLIETGPKPASSEKEVSL